MKRNRYITISCCGRGPDGQGVLENPIKIVIELSPSKVYLSNDIAVVPYGCRFNTGGHKQRCKASHPDKDKVGGGVLCPFSFDYPYAKENDSDWKVPDELVDIIEKMEASSS